MKTSRWTEDLASITDALWAKRGERGILPEAGDEGEKTIFFSSPHLAIRAFLAVFSRLTQNAVLDSPLS